MKKVIIILLIIIFVVFVSMGAFLVIKLIKENRLMQKTIEDFLKDKKNYAYSIFGIYPNTIKELSLEEFKEMFTKNKFTPIEQYINNKEKFLKNVKDVILYYNYDENKLGRSLYLILDLGETKVLGIFIYYKNILDLIFKK